MARTFASRSSTSSRSATPSRPGQVPIGRLVGSHGLHGDLRLDCMAEAPETLRGVTRVRVEGERPDAPDLLLQVEGLAAHGNGVRLRLAGIDTRDAADALRGRWVWAQPSQLEPLEHGEFYGYQLVGCELVGDDGTRIGSVRDLWRTGAPDVLVVDGDEGREYLIPAALLRSVDLVARRAVVELLPGLLDPEDAA